MGGEGGGNMDGVRVVVGGGIVDVGGWEGVGVIMDKAVGGEWGGGTYNPGCA